MRKHVVRRALGTLLPLLAFAGNAVAQVPPDVHWRTIESEHFRVTFAPGLEALADRAADHAESAYARLAEELGRTPGGKIDILLTDYADVSNGFATPYPSNRIVLYAPPPVEDASLSYFEDWMDLVVTHELAHLFHLDAYGAPGAVLRRIFGRLPITWPVFPGVGTPGWSAEGLATYIESAYTGAGRVHGTYHDMVLRTAVLEGTLASLDRVTGAGPRWPGGHVSYIYGSMFADYLAERYGPEVHREIVGRTARAWVPPALAFDRIGRKAMGRSFTDLYQEWRARLEAEYGRLADSLRAEGLTAPERLTDAGYLAGRPRVGPDGRVAFVAMDGRNPSMTRIVDPVSGRVRDLARRNGLDAVAWLPDGAILTAQLEFDGPYRLYGDLYRVAPDGAERRITEGARLRSPDVTRDGRKVVAVQGIGGTNRLVVYDLETGTLEPLTEAAPDVHWAYPRWSPGGDRIAASRWQAGNYDVVILDARGAVLREWTADRAVDAAPAWSPDGRYVVFSSDRSGIPNLYAYDLAAPDGGDGALRQVTNVLTGAFHPDVSPDGRWIYFAGYHADGFHIERVPFDPSQWRAPSPVRTAYLVAERAAPGRASTRRARPYSAWPTLVPRAWVPQWYEEGGTFVGAAVAGEDLVGRHAFGAAAAYNTDRGLFAGRMSYAFAGLGNPVLGLAAWRDWEDLAIVPPEGAPDAAMMLREDGVALTAEFRRRRFRSDMVVGVGAERVVEHRELFDAPGYAPAYPGTALHGLEGWVAYSSAQVHPFSISREDGVSFAVSGLRRWDAEPFTLEDGRILDRSYDEFSAAASVYRGFPLFGFADHVLALRIAGAARKGPGAGPFDIGGAAAGTSRFGDGIGGGDDFLPVRGFAEGDRIGTRGWAASLEYRLPLALLDRGYRLWPVYFDRLSAAAFLDAGDAWCTEAERTDFTNCSAEAREPIVGAGAELGISARVLGLNVHVRAGIGVPVAGGASGARPVGYVQFGPSF